MAKIALTAPLRQEYEDLFDTCAIRPARTMLVDQLCDGIVADRSTYEEVAVGSGVPWAFVAIVHNMESDRQFDRHLHNGDPLIARTVQVPAGHPKTGAPPFAWSVSCADALALRGLGAHKDWSLAGTLFELEGYNGWGYRRYHPDVRSPYLWSFSNHYTSGKYVKDGVWSPDATSKQCGAAVLLRRLAERGDVTFQGQPSFGAPAPPLVRFATTRPTDAAMVARAEALQRWLNTLPGVWVKVDGIPGARTSSAVHAALGSYLAGDPRVA